MELISISNQTVPYGQAVQLTARKPCNKGYVIHREGSGIMTLRGIVNSPCNTFARYQITCNTNIAIPEGGTVGEISIGIAISGEADGASIAAFTPAAVSTYGNVTSTTQIDVPRGCCFNVSIENTSSTQGSIDMKNTNVVIDRIG